MPRLQMPVRYYDQSAIVADNSHVWIGVMTADLGKEVNIEK